MPLNHRTPSPFTALLLAAAVGASGCLTITPPIRNAGYGAPGHAAPDEFEIGVGHDLNVWFTGDEDAVIPGLFKLNLVAPVWHDSPTPGRVNTVRLEFAGDFFMGGWGYAIAGFRFDSAPEGQGKGRRGLAWDIEAGVAGGGCRPSRLAAGMWAVESHIGRAFLPHLGVSGTRWPAPAWRACSPRCTSTRWWA